MSARQLTPEEIENFLWETYHRDTDYWMEERGVERELPQFEWEKNIVDRDWLRTLTNADLADFITQAWKSSNNANRLGMADAYNHHRTRARVAELEVERRAQESKPCPACQGRGKDEYMGIVLPKPCSRCHGTGRVSNP